MDVIAEQASSVLTVERLAEIRKLCKDAQFGYAVVNNQVYFKDVSTLLADRELWLAANAELHQRLAALIKENEKLYAQCEKPDE